MPKRLFTPMSKHWCLTINNPVEADVPDWTTMSYCILGKEVGLNGTKHLQGYCCFINRKRLSGAKKVWPRAHLEIKIGSVHEAITYCKKDGNFKEMGIVPLTKEEAFKKRWTDAIDSAKNGKFEDIPADMLVRCYHNFKRIHQDNPPIPEDLKERHNYWVIAPSKYGKSTYVRERWGPSMVTDIYDHGPNKWWIGYKGQPTILLDDFGPRQCMYLGWYMKRWADKFSFPMETKGGGYQIRPKRIVLTSQKTIEQCFPDVQECEAIKNRFTVINLPHWKKRIILKNNKDSVKN